MILRSLVSRQKPQSFYIQERAVHKIRKKMRWNPEKGQASEAMRYTPGHYLGHPQAHISRMQVRVTVMPFAISGGIVLLSRDSMLLQSAIIFVVNSERSLGLKKFIGSFRRCSAIRSRVVFDSLYDAI